MDLEQIQEQALDIARVTGELLRQGFRQTKQIEYKSSAIDIVTQYDTEAEAFIIQRLRQLFPDHEIFAEEGDYGRDSKSHFTWYVDPIDGTNNFAHGYPVFAISLALYEDERPLLGVIYDPLRDECFHAIRGRGAYLTAPSGREALRVTETRELVHSLLATGFPYDRHHSDLDNVAQFTAFLKRARGIRRAGSACLDLAYVAAGRLDGYWEYKLGQWDVAAGILLVQEAGGRVTTMDNRSFQLDRAGKVALIASNGNIHDAMVHVLEGVTTVKAGTSGG